MVKASVFVDEIFLVYWNPTKCARPLYLLVCLTHPIVDCQIHHKSNIGKTLINIVHRSSMFSRTSIYIIPGWWFQPPWKILVSWDYYSQYMGKLKMFQTTSQIHYNDIPQSIPIVIFSLPAPSLASKMRSPRTSRCQTAMFGALVRDFFQFLSWEYIWYINHYIYYIL